MSFALCPLPFPSEAYIRGLDNDSLEQYALEMWGEKEGAEEGWPVGPSPDGREGWVLSTIKAMTEAVEDLEAEVDWSYIPIVNGALITYDEYADNDKYNILQALGQLPCYIDFWKRWNTEYNDFFFNRRLTSS